MPDLVAFSDLQKRHATLKVEYTILHGRWLTETDSYAKAVYFEEMDEVLWRACEIFRKMMLFEGTKHNGA